MLTFKFLDNLDVSVDQSLKLMLDNTRTILFFIDPETSTLVIDENRSYFKAT